MWVWAYLLFSLMTAVCLMQGVTPYATYSLAAITLIVLIRLCFVDQNNRPRKGHYTMPWVPILPAIGIFFNFTLCAGLDGTTWTYFGVFLALGIVIYFTYGLWHSNLEADNVTRGLDEVSLISVMNRRDSFE